MTKAKLILLLLITAKAYSANYYFSTSTGDDSRNSTQAQSPSTPWQTISKLNSFFSSLNAGDSVLFKRGEVFDGSIIIDKSGSSDNPIIIAAYGTGTKPIINGFQTLTGWANLGGNIWESSAIASAPAAVNMVTLNDTVKALGRYPNSNAGAGGYLTYQTHVGTTSITSSAIASAPSFVGGELVIRTNRFAIDRCIITAQTSTTITYTTQSGYTPSDGFGFFFENSINTLDQFGEWYYNSSTHKVDMYFAGNNPASYTVKAAVVDTLLKSNTFNYITVYGLSFKGANKVSASIRNGSNFSIKNCDLIYSGRDAVNIVGATAQIIDSCLINYSNSRAVLHNVAGLTLTNTTIRNTAVFPGMAWKKSNDGNMTAIDIQSATVTNNNIIGTGYIPLMFHGDNCLIKNNYIDSFCFNKDDGGGIYTSNQSGTLHTGNVVDANIVLNGLGATNATNSTIGLGHGIYLDDLASNISTTNNTVANCTRGIFIHEGNNNVVRSNTVFNNTEGFFTQYNSGPGITGCTITSNIFFAKASTQLCSYLSSTSNDIAAIGTFDSNYYCRPIFEPNNIQSTSGSAGGIIRTSIPGTTFYSLDRWQTQFSKDANSKKTAASISNVNQVRFEYNATNAAVVIPLTQTYVGVDGTSYSCSVTLQPYTSLILLIPNPGIIIYPHKVYHIQNPHYITSFSQATNTDTNVVKSTTVLGGQYVKLNGTSQKPIVIFNEGGAVAMTGGIEIDDCSYLEIIGWGSNDAFGFQYLNGNNSGVPVHIVGKSHHITIKGYKLVGGINGGIWAKTENSEVQSRYNCDMSYLTTPMTNLTLSCNWIENNGGEAYYIGSTGWYGRDPLTCNGNTTNPEPQKIGYIHCDSNIIINPGRTGAQMSGSIPNDDNFGTFIGNQIYYPGRELNSQQGTGLSIGGGFKNSTVSNNVVHCSYLYNYYIVGYGNVIFRNNIGDTAGYWKNVKNPQQIPGSVFSTSLGPVAWKITGNTEGYNSSQPSTGYALYTSNKNADTGNIICNNTGNLVIFGSLNYSNTCSNTNMPPVVKAGSNATLTLPQNTYQLSGSAYDPDGTILSLLWTPISGPTYTIDDATILTPILSNLVQGVYKFALTATDNGCVSASASDTVKITVNAAVINNAPVADAGADITIQSPINFTQLNGTATDDVSVSSTVWTQIAGTAATISNANILNPNITGLSIGTSTFRLIVTDGAGLKDTDDVNVIVLPAVNIPPVVFAGNDTSITLPATTVNLNGTATDADGGTPSVLWSNSDGCSITSATSVITTATCTTPGQHTFTLVGTDDDGATTQDQMIATVIQPANTPPVAIAAPDATVYLPVDSLVLNQSGTDADGTIQSYLSTIIQTKFNAIISRGTTTTPALKNFNEGDTIKILLQVTDDDGATAYDTTTVIVLDTTNTAPFARINRDTTTYLDPPVGQISVSGANSYDNDNGDYIAAYAWQQTSGAITTLTGSTSAVVQIGGMTPGTYEFRLTVTDSKGLTDFIDFSITVSVQLRFKIQRGKVRPPESLVPPPPEPVPFKHGFNNSSIDSAQNKMKSNSSVWATVKAVNDSYGTVYIRYPGGTPSLSYFPDTLGRISNKILFDFFTFIGDTENADKYQDKNTRYHTYDFEQFLRMAQAQLFTPIILLNNQFYRDGDSIYLLVNLVDKDGNVFSAGGLHGDRWTVALDSLTNTVNFAHSIYPGVIYWELGNECYARMSAADYAETATQFIRTIKALYPNDKFIAPISKGEYQHNPIENDQWNHDIIYDLNQNGVLNDISHFAPHYYHASRSYPTTEQELIDQLNNRYFENVYNYLMNDAGFPAGYNPHLFYTEYASATTALGSDSNPGTNTQYHALVQLDLMMKMHSKTNIAGGTSHTWLNATNATFYDSTSAQQIGYIPTTRHDNAYFAFIPPQAIADSLFIATAGNEPIEGRSTLVLSQYRVCVSKTNNTTYTQILNFTSSPQSYVLTGGTVNWTAIELNDLMSYDWNVTANKTTGSATGTLTLPARSFIFFNE